MDDSPSLSPVDRRRFLRSAGVGALGVSLAGCSSNSTANSRATGRANDANSLDAVRVQNQGFQIRRGDDWQSIVVRGVNLGLGKPGRFPGETAITREEYERWFQQLSAMNANVLRVYTVHPPAFYNALAAHNAQASQPLYLLHGNWLPITRIEEPATAFDDSIADFFDRRLRTVVDVIHGNKELPERRGYAAGSYTTDVSDYVLGYIVGIEWEPQFVLRTNEEHDGGETEGRFVQASAAADAFERWLALRVDSLTTYADETYDHRRPVSFANWPTTDHLSHPSEPSAAEDAVSVNPNAVVTTTEFSPGVFATYHAYPYYPDFLNFSPEYTEYTDGTGEKNSYAGYLNDLVDANDHPVLIGEFGVPASRGNAHEHVHGMDQGYHTETQQGEYNAELFETLVDAGTAGGAVFAWQDEWFKRTWNTMEYTDPNRRPFWLNVQSPEERFGLLSFDPQSPITLSGEAEEWVNATTVATGSPSPRVALDDGYDTGRSLRDVQVDSDEAYLYVRIQYDDLGDTVDWSRMHTLAALDITPDRGNTSLPRNVGLNSERGFDFVVELAGQSSSRVEVASHYDVFYYSYGHQDGVIDTAPYASEVDNGEYHPIRLATSYRLEIPGQDRTVPFRSIETGRLRFGTADPTHSQYDSLTDVHVDGEHNTIEMRLPWQLLNFRDPSTRTILGDFWEDGLETGEQIDDIGVSVITYKPTANGDAQSLSDTENTTDILSSADHSRSGIGEPQRYTLETWQQPQYRERLKQSYHILQETFDQY